MNDTPSADDRRSGAEPGRSAGIVRMVADLVGMRRLHQLHAALATETDLESALAKIVAAACEFTGTDRGYIQLVSDDGIRLELAATCGHASDSPFVDMLRRENLKQDDAVDRGKLKRTRVEDLATHPGLAPEYRAMLESEGIAAWQSAPMISRNGVVIGVLGTQFHQPHRCSESEWHMLDLLAWIGVNFVERHRAALAMRQSEEKYRLLFESTDEAFCITELVRDDNGDVVDLVYREINREFTRQTGLTDVVGRTMREVQPSLGLHWLAACARAAETGEPFYLENHDAETDRWYCMHFSPLGKKDAAFIAVVFDDITARKKTELALRNSEASLRRAQVWLSAQKEAFQAAMNGKPLTDSLGVLARAVVEHSASECRCAFYVVDKTGTGLQHVVGMSEAHAREVDSFDISAESLACGLAVATGEPVITPDVFEEPRWQPWLELARAHDYRGCWSFPVETASGTLVGALAMYFAQPREATAYDLKLAEALTHTAGIIISRHQETEERAQAEAALRESETRYRSVVQWATDGIWLADPEGRFVEVNDAGCRMLGYSPEQYRQLNIHDLVQSDEEPRLRKLIDTLKHGGQSTEIWKIRHVDGHYVPVESSQCITPCGYWQIIGRDVTEQVRARERQQLLLMEINHRVKNTLATVQSIVAQSLRNASTLEEGAAALESRLISLSSAHNVLVREHWEGGDLHEVVKNILAAYPDKAGASRFRVRGIDVRLQPRAVVSLSMALHELATNAVKYGALSGECGYVDIVWEVDGGKASDRRFRLCWSEHDGPPVHVPENRGFGSRLIESGLAMEMEGEARLDFNQEGLTCTIIAPLNKISGEARWSEG
ncbi:MAG TPA: GAF domain-containing protein [Oleiagrimonas sp.]|nr:GAF domain-containing protein [Oleiagrimonas sp.]